MTNLDFYCIIVLSDVEFNDVDVIEFYRDRSKEQGISNEWVIEFGNKFKPIIDEFFKKD